MTDTTLVAPTQRTDAALAASVDHFAALVRLKSAIMKKGVDYGTIPGCGGKDSLFKPGAEKTLKNFMVHTSPEDTTIEDLAVAGEHRYRIIIGGRTPDGIVRGFGLGECSTTEDKYAWRKVASQAEFDAAPNDRRRIKYHANYTAQQVRVNPADQANTVLKMAKKRAMVDLALTSCAASEFFTQDVEDLPVELRGEIIDIPPGDVQPEPVAPHPAPRAVAPEPAAERPPEDWPVKKRVHWYMQRLGLTPAAVVAAAAQVKAPENADDWNDFDGQSIIETLHKPPVEPAPAAPAAPKRTHPQARPCKQCGQLAPVDAMTDGLCPTCTPPPEPAKRTRRSRCKDCGELKIGVKLGQCPDCAAPAATADPPAGDHGKPDQTCEKCGRTGLWAAQLKDGLCGDCQILTAALNTPGFLCAACGNEPVAAEGGKCRACAMNATKPPARPRTPDQDGQTAKRQNPRDRVLAEIRGGVAAGRFDQAAALGALSASPDVADSSDDWTHKDADAAVALLEAMDTADA